MPTQEEFEVAADYLFTAAARVEEVATSVQQFDVAAILRGGVLGRQVPARLASSANLARVSAARMEATAATCLERAAIIADYLVRLAAYDIALGKYEQASFQYYTSLAHWEASDGRSSHPGGTPPVAPTPPDHPPAWADVRRV